MEHRSKYWLIAIRSSDEIFDTRSERFAFLNIWRTYTRQAMQTCAYSLIPDRFECVVTGPDEEPVTGEEMLSQVKAILLKKMSGIWPESKIRNFCSAIEIKPLLTAKDCIYSIFDLHTQPQKTGFSTDYRTYPFSSFRALSSSQPTALARPLVWEWFGGRMRFAAFHHAYAGWAGHTGT